MKYEIENIDEFVCEGLIKAYPVIMKKVDLIDDNIKRFGAFNINSTTESIVTNILDSIERKNKLINLKLCMDNAIKHLHIKHRQILTYKLYYPRSSTTELLGILNLSERTAFRRIDLAYKKLAEELNNLNRCLCLDVINNEPFLLSTIEICTARRKSFKTRQFGRTKAKEM